MGLPKLQDGARSQFEEVLGIQQKPTPSKVVRLPQRAPSLNEVRGWLEVLESDLPYDEWRNVVWGVRATGLPDGEALARGWSARGAKYDAGAFDTVWSTFSPDGGIGVGTLKRMAREAGFREPSTAKYRLLSSAEILAMPSMSWRVKGVLPETGVAAIFGPSGSGKSFLAFDLACAIADGDTWFGHRTAKAPVSIVWLEGEAGIGNRLKAYATHHGRAVPDAVGVVAQPFDITSEDLEALADVLPRDGVVIIDTLNRAAPGRDENSSVDMGLIISGAKALQARVGGLVVFVHHSGKDTSKGLRGHSSLHAALDAVIEVRREKNGRSWSIAKSKDGADGEDHNFRLEVVTLGMDEDGDFITSCVAVPDLEWVRVPNGPTGKNQKTALPLIHSELRAQFGPWKSADQSPRLSQDELVARVAPHMNVKKGNKQAAREAVLGLLVGGHLVEIEGGLLSNPMDRKPD